MIWSAYWFLPFVGTLFFSVLLGVRKPLVEKGLLVVSTVMGLYFLSSGCVTGSSRNNWAEMAQISWEFFLFLGYCAIAMAYVICVAVTSLRARRGVMDRLRKFYILSSLTLGMFLFLLSTLSFFGVGSYPASNFIFIPLGVLAYGVMGYRILDMGSLMPLVLYRVVHDSLVIVPNVIAFMLLKPVMLQGELGLTASLLLGWYAINCFYISRLHPVVSRQVNRYRYRLRSAEVCFARDLLILRDIRSLVTEFGELVRSTLAFKTTHFFFAAEEGGGLKDIDGHDVLLHPETTAWLIENDSLLDRYLLEVKEAAIHEVVFRELKSLFDSWDGLCSVPLVQHGELIGLVILADKRGGGLVLPVEVGFLEKVSRYLSIALYNSRVYQAVASLKDELELRRQELSREILERSRAKESVRQSEERYRLLAENILDVLVVVNAESEEILYISPSCKKVTGYKAIELEGESVWALFHPDHRKDALVKIPSRQDRSSFLVELEILRKDGGRTWVEVSCHYVEDGSGAALELIGLARDISYRRDAELEKDELHKRLRQAQKMESIGVLAGGIAHDFNNILMGILGYTQLAAFYLEEEGGQASKIVSQIETAGMRAKELVSQILAFSRQNEQVRCAVDMCSVTREALGLIRATLPKGIEVIASFSDTPAMVVADPVQIHQIVLNLCTNAFHALEERGGTISVSVTCMEMDAGEARRLGVEPGAYVALRVSDTGDGMDADIQTRIFDPYFTTKGAGKGTGMGLAVVQGIILSHNGTVVVDSEKGKGSRFQVYLPETATPKQSAGFVGETDVLSMGRVLFVDDETMLVGLAREALGRMGFDVVALEDPQEALKAFEANPTGFDVVVTDMTMPKMSGLGLAEHLREINHSVPVILCTGFSNDLMGKEPRELGVSCVLFKPVSMNDLAETIRTVKTGWT
ncbi:MAG: response regulator [Desulfobacterales bacterium]|nr:response regulator [Desulfobacterales bacterium]